MLATPAPIPGGGKLMTLKNAIASSLIIALGLILIVHFTLFWVYGGVFIYEGNKIILSVETAMSVAVLAFGIERLMSISRPPYRLGDPRAPGTTGIERDGSAATASSDSPRTHAGTTAPAATTSSTTGILDIAPIVVQSGCSSSDGWASDMTDCGACAGDAPVAGSANAKGSPRQKKRPAKK